MKHSIPNWQLAGFLFTAALGTFLHFLFDLTGQNWIAGLFSAVNESIWEHMKLIFYPMFLFALVENRVWGKDVPQFWCIKLLGILLGVALIPALYYTYTGIFGENIDWINIAIFFLTAAVSYRLETVLFQRGYACRLQADTALVVLWLIAAVFTLLTFRPPMIPLFQDPQDGTFGLQI